jgi:hypothetical protein
VRVADDSEIERLNALRAATDRAAAGHRDPWAIIGTLLTAVSSDEPVTALAVELLDALSSEPAAS